MLALALALTLFSRLFFELEVTQSSTKRKIGTRSCVLRLFLRVHHSGLSTDFMPMIGYQVLSLLQGQKAIVLALVRFRHGGKAVTSAKLDSSRAVHMVSMPARYLYTSHCRLRTCEVCRYQNFQKTP